jgi:hypothetical protein
MFPVRRAPENCLLDARHDESAEYEPIFGQRTRINKKDLIVVDEFGDIYAFASARSCDRFERLLLEISDPRREWTAIGLAGLVLAPVCLTLIGNLIKDLIAAFLAFEEGSDVEECGVRCL